jgi:hypothetical protein
VPVGRAARRTTPPAVEALQHHRRARTAARMCMTPTNRRSVLVWTYSAGPTSGALPGLVSLSA